MKIIIVLFAISALVCSTFAQKATECTLPHAVIGRCKAAMPSYTYNSNTQSCVKFIYGGCGGNKNRFGSLGECERRCKKNQRKIVPRNA